MQSIKLLNRSSVNLLKKYVARCLSPELLGSVEGGQMNTIRRYKYSSTIGVKGMKSKKYKLHQNSNDEDDEEVENDESLELDDSNYDSLVNNAMHVTKNIVNGQKVFVIQPYIKWGPRKSDTSPELKLQEAEALIRSIPKWECESSLKIPVESLDKRNLFGIGKLEEIRQLMHSMRSAGKMITCVFISKGTLTNLQKRNLEHSFGVPVMDRYSVVIQILRLHATSKEAKLQVAMAEIPYIWSQVRENADTTNSLKRLNYNVTDTQRQMLRNREKKLKLEIANVRNHREILRHKRKQNNFPIVAVVGYTNAGKTSLIKALTNEQSLQPRDQLFATLDVTAHGGLLPSNLKVIYMDTVGFMSDIPTGLIECFVATLEDAMLADVIIHVHDVSHENYAEQCRHVEETLSSLLTEANNSEKDRLLKNIINVGNKCDLIASSDERTKFQQQNLQLISSKTFAGIADLLVDVEEKILTATNRRKLIVKVPMGGEESAWLYKNAAVTSTEADPKNSQSMLVNVVISEAKLNQFRHIFLKRK